jgi:hypothetical protein
MRWAVGGTVTVTVAIAVIVTVSERAKENERSHKNEKRNGFAQGVKPSANGGPERP